ncbi:MAG: DegV family protein [Erysipelotrichia bacterium]|nr:DegV family protein [Erysipelotrichia bacterium]NCC54468.1 DegV family protein [Erysipelotrichia bacterium]
MKNYLIVTDSTSALSLERAQELGVVLVPTSVILEGKHYKDHYEMTKEQLYEHLRNGKVPTTSQPSVGYIEELMREWKAKQYDAIIVVTCSAGLSGTYQSFHMAKEELNMDNVYLIDSRSVGAPIMDMVVEAKKMSEADAKVDDIVEMIQAKCAHSYSFLFPESLVQLKKGGRISPVAANMASLLKIKPLLYLADNGNVVDKFTMARTEAKIFSAAIEQFVSEKVVALTHKLYISHAANLEAANRFITFAKSKMNDIECELVDLPAVLTCHGGLGCIAMQSTLKHKQEK